MNWTTVCSIEAIVPGTGVCALLGEEQVAIFRPHADETLYALSNIDPFFEASVLSRGLLVEHQGQLCVASPLKKQRFRLADGVCVDNEAHRLRSYAVRVVDGRVALAG